MPCMNIRCDTGKQQTCSWPSDRQHLYSERKGTVGFGNPRSFWTRPSCPIAIWRKQSLLKKQYINIRYFKQNTKWCITKNLSVKYFIVNEFSQTLTKCYTHKSCFDSINSFNLIRVYLNFKTHQQFDNNNILFYISQSVCVHSKPLLNLITCYLHLNIRSLF